MNWEAIGAIGEMVSAIGVIATLGYLAVQIKQNTRAIRGATLNARENEYSQFVQGLLSERDWRRSERSPAEADPST